LLGRLQDRFDTAIMAAELLSEAEVDIVQRHIPRSRIPFETTPPWSLMVELGSSDASAPLSDALEDMLASSLDEGGAVDAVIARSSAQAGEIWHVRHSVSEANKLHGHSLSHDVAVRPSRVPDLIERCNARIADRYPQAVPLIVAHIGDGNVHYIVHFRHEQWNLLPDPDDVTERVMTLVHDEVATLGGTFSAEHGIGRKLNAEMARLGDPIRLQVMSAIKGLFDPSGRMNPGALFPR
jgi:FAD/FMN-containing dehydrogenase